MRRCLLIAGVLFAGDALAQSRFEGNLALEPSGCEVTGQCISKNALRFTDQSSVVWEAQAGLPTDGASIPPLFQPFVGEPFDQQFIKAAIVHDHYCDRHVRPWKQTHRVFYEGLIDQGVPKGKAKTMYYAVYLAGPRWARLIPGRRCGDMCVNAVQPEGRVGPVITREAQYDKPGLSGEMNEIDKQLSANPDALSLEDLERRADQKDPNDLFLLKSEEIPASNDMLAQ